jgi:hypothetical protein
MAFFDSNIQSDWASMTSANTALSIYRSP